MNYAYLHGFAKDANAPKGRRLSEVFRQHGLELRRPELNQPSFSELTYTGMLEELDRMHAESNGDAWRLIGASLGGYIAARWAELYPERVDRLMLLSPAFDMLDVWVELLGESLLCEWREEGEFLFFGPDDTLTPVHWELFVDARDRHPDYPEVDVPTRVVHGRHDELVPLENSKNFVERTPSAELMVVDDAHDLSESIWRVANESLLFLTSPRRATPKDGRQHVPGI